MAAGARAGLTVVGQTVVGRTGFDTCGHPDRWRLDQLVAWEERRMASGETPLDPLIARSRELLTITDLLPHPKTRRRSA